MGNRSRFLLLSGVLVAVDAAILELLTIATGTGPLLGRLLSLSGGFATAALLARLLPAATGRRYPAGFWPLVGVGLLLSYGIFAVLAGRTPHIQPLVHLAVSWLGAAVFGGFGFWRIRRWRNED